MSVYLDIKDLHLSYGSVDVLKGVALAVEQGDVIALTGPSGCGKTSLLRCVAGFEKPQKGSIQCGGIDLLPLPTEKRNIGMVFQGNALFPHMSVEKNLAFGIPKLDKAMRKEAVANMLKTLDLAGYEKRKPHELSGGQQQRVAIGRSLITRPRLLLMDEPFSDLDTETKTRVRADIKALLQQHAITTLIVSHHADDVESMAGRVVEMG